MKYFQHFSCRVLPLAVFWLFLSQHGFAQNSIFVNMAPVDGIDVTPDNLFSFQVQSSLPQRNHTLIRGTIRFRNSEMRIAYKFEYDLQPGINIIPAAAIRPQYEYSSQALRELFEQYRKLPQGIYEYCVSVKPDYTSSETTPGPVYEECVYHKSEDIFLINLIDPEDDARIHEYNPMLSWTVNYPFASELTYRIRVAEIRKGQNTAGAIARNNPVYEENNLMQMSTIYPVYAKPLEKDQPYAWTVDAYYKGILLGGAEPWKFTIVEDSLLVAVSPDQSYYDFADHIGETNVYAYDTLKLKYQSYKSADSLYYRIIDERGDTTKFNTAFSVLRPGMNYIDLDFPGKVSLRHNRSYTLIILNSDEREYRLPFVYVNPLFIRK